MFLSVPGVCVKPPVGAVVQNGISKQFYSSFTAPTERRKFCSASVIGRLFPLGLPLPVAIRLRKLPLIYVPQALEHRSKHSYSGTKPRCVKRTSVWSPC